MIKADSHLGCPHHIVSQMKMRGVRAEVHSAVLYSVNKDSDIGYKRRCAPDEKVW